MPELHSEPRPEITVRPGEVKALYSTGWVAGIPGRINRLIQLIDETELNAIVIDVKDDTGLLTYKSGVPLAGKIGASHEKVKDIGALLDTCYEKNIYPIARIVVFKDPVLASRRPDLAIKDETGKLWRDRKGIAWADPTKREVWEYNVEVAKEAARLGFKEIQFDYVRFPDEKSYKAISGHSEATRVDTITRFLQYAKQQLAPYKVAVSADVFGLTCSATDDMGIGQKIEEIAGVVDYISPMVYPSHFASGSYGIEDPDAHPYETVKKSLSDGLGRIAGKGALMRPWLQDFSLRRKYGPEDVRIQIKVAHELGIGTWMIWNPSSEFTALALRQELPVLSSGPVAGPSPTSQPSPCPEPKNDTACGTVQGESPVSQPQDTVGQLPDATGPQARPGDDPTHQPAGPGLAVPSP
ncbi:MAG TPA: putative glycoside hydrolase [Firmicutes bacterium]|nr:putative glycoside hydrolase [Bacillota bacterium]